jgi:hypothetical protein
MMKNGLTNKHDKDWVKPHTYYIENINADEAILVRRKPKKKGE